jgi:hypothetical protein
MNHKCNATNDLDSTQPNLWERFSALVPGLGIYSEPVVITLSSSKRKVCFQTQAATLELDFDLRHCFEEKKLPCLYTLTASNGSYDPRAGDLFELEYFGKVKEILNKYFVK